MRKTAYLLFFVLVAIMALALAPCQAMGPSLDSKLIMATTWTTGTNIGSTDLSPPTTALNQVGYEVQITITAATRALEKSGAAVQNEQFAASTRTIIVNTNQAIIIGLAYSTDVTIVESHQAFEGQVAKTPGRTARDGIRAGPPAPAQVATCTSLETTTTADATSSGPGDKSATLALA